MWSDCGGRWTRKVLEAWICAHHSRFREVVGGGHDSHSETPQLLNCCVSLSRSKTTWDAFDNKSISGKMLVFWALLGLFYLVQCSEGGKISHQEVSSRLLDISLETNDRSLVEAVAVPVSITLSGLQASDVSGSVGLKYSLRYALFITLQLTGELSSQVSDPPVVTAISSSFRDLRESAAASTRPQSHPPLSAATFASSNTDVDVAPMLLRAGASSSRRLVASCSVAMTVTSTMSASAVQSSLGAAGAAATFVSRFKAFAKSYQYAGNLSAVTVPGLTVAGTYLPAVAPLPPPTHYLKEYFTASDCSGAAYYVSYVHGSETYIASAYQTSPCSPSTSSYYTGFSRATKYTTPPTLPLGFTTSVYSLSNPSADASQVCAAGGDATTTVIDGYIQQTIAVSGVCKPSPDDSGVGSMKYSCTAKGYATQYYQNDNSCASLTSQGASPFPVVGCTCPYPFLCQVYSCTGAPPIPPASSLTGGLNTDVTAAVIVLVAVVFGFAALIGAVLALHRMKWSVSMSTKPLEKFARKMYAISPLFFVIYNTIVSIYGLGRGATTKSMARGQLTPASFMGFYGYDISDASAGYLPFANNSFIPKTAVFWGHTCTAGVPSALTLTCSFDNNVGFQYGLYIWVAFFVFFFFYRVALLWSYSPDDLRFYIATQRLNGMKGNFVFLFFLFALSVVTFLATIYLCIILRAGTSGYIQAAVFVVVNLLASMNLSTIEYKMYAETPSCFGLVKLRKLKTMDLFSKPCPLCCPHRSEFGSTASFCRMPESSTSSSWPLHRRAWATTARSGPSETRACS